ncbi:hypothetical protein [Terrabacter sp. NPDC080008]|uniref:hypothetical protein n=1 Tax=Terrabacter sp. NPDC080008 TaxID=3155176 RepID=UPI00344BBC1D
MTDEKPPQTGSGLRAQLTRALADLKAARGRIAELEEENYTLRLGEVLSVKRVPVELRRLALQNRVEASPEAVDRFLSDLRAEVETASQALGAIPAPAPTRSA